MSLFELSLKEIRQRLEQKEITVTDLVNESLERIRQTEPKIRAFITVDEEGARQAAAKLDEELAAGSEAGSSGRGQLFGVPAAIKDNIVTEGLLTTCASRFLANHIPIYDASVIKKLKDARSVIVGKLNMDEFAMGGSSENSAYHATRNPWDLERVPGGSSSGSAAAVAAGQVSFALGSDTGGSIRQPASYCGVVGLKPTYGRVSRFGLVAFASSLDQIGPITRTVEDAACVLQAIAGHDPLDSTSAAVEVPDYIGALTGDIRGLRIAVPKEYLGAGVDAKVKEKVQEAIRVLEGLGATCEEVSLPHTEYAVAAYYIISSSEASSNLSRFDGIRYGARAEDAADLMEVYLKSRSRGFGPEVKRRIMLGTYALSTGFYDAYYRKAQKVRTLIKQDFDNVFESFDLIVGPTTPTTAFKIGEQIDDPLAMYLNDILTISVSLAGLPAMSVPCGLADGLPVGLQMIARPFGEPTLLRAAHAFEGHTDFHKAKPQAING